MYVIVWSSGGGFGATSGSMTLLHAALERSGRAGTIVPTDGRGILAAGRGSLRAAAAGQGVYARWLRRERAERALDVVEAATAARWAVEDAAEDEAVYVEDERMAVYVDDVEDAAEDDAE